MKRVGKLIYIICFVLMLIVPTVFMNTAAGVKSDLDNRYLADFPALNGDGFKTGFESYVKDRIGFRNQMIHAYDLVNDRLFGELTHPTYTYGKEGYVFFNMHNNIKYGSFHKIFAETILKIQQYVEDRGGHFYFIFEPEKISVYRQFLPDGVNYDDGWVDQFIAYLDELGVHYVDSRVVLNEKAKTETVFDRKYDAGHWNDLGEYYATEQLLERIHQDVPEVLPLQKSMFDIKEVNAKYLRNSEFVIDETIPRFTLKTQYDNVTKKWSGSVKVNSSFNHFHYYINKTDGAESLPKLLIFQGSYYNRRPEYFVPSFSECIGVHNYQNVLNIEYYYNLFTPDVVILDAAEYVLTNYYFNQSNMKDLALSPPLDTSAKWIRSGMSARVNLKEGSAVDLIQLRIPFSGVRNAWLVCGEHTFDLTADTDGKYKLETAHGNISSGSECSIYVQLQTGERYVIDSAVRIVEDLLSDPVLSEHAACKDDTISFTTQTEGNTFNAVDVQIYSPNRKTFLKLVKRISKTGKVSFTYVHELASGSYCIRLKANSNLKDEYADYVIYLETNEQYTISFTINDLSEKSAEVASFMFTGPKVRKD